MNSIPLSYPEFNSKDFIAVHNAMNKINQNDKDAVILEFEDHLASFHQVKHAALFSSGSAAIHLALLALKIKSGDKVIVPTLTFAATAFPLLYLGANPVFLDVCEKTWTLDLDLLENYLRNCLPNDIPKLIISVDLFGKTCDYDRLIDLSNRFQIPILIDSAEALGTKYKDTFSASLGNASVISFNFNKILTSTGGGVLLTNNDLINTKARKLANQARENNHWYEHTEVGYNYRLSPILAALGNSQLSRINLLVSRRRKIRDFYFKSLSNIPGIEVNLDSEWEFSNAWLSTVKFDRVLYPTGRDDVWNALKQENIESRFIWKPLHLQPVFKPFKSILTGVSEEIFDTSLCLPSGHKLNEMQIQRICSILKKGLKLDKYI